MTPPAKTRAASLTGAHALFGGTSGSLAVIHWRIYTSRVPPRGWRNFPFGGSRALALRRWRLRSRFLLFQQIADFGQELLVLGQGDIGAVAHHPCQELFHKQEQGHGDDKEVDQLAEELAVGDDLVLHG